MTDKKKVAVMSNKTRIFSVIDGNIREKENLSKKASWMPASAGMTTDVGGNSQ